MRQISYFLALCEEQSFTRAARRSGVAQPSFTRAIQLLEQEFGDRLFERNSATVRLTELGTLVRPDFERIDRAAADVAQKVAEFRAAPSEATAAVQREVRVQIDPYVLQSRVNATSLPKKDVREFY